jgi:superfamily II DNA/RNA helicase
VDKDVMGAAQTGTGKTAAFSLPLLQRHPKAREHINITCQAPCARAGVVAQLGELADQVAQQIKTVRQVHPDAQRCGVWWHGHEASNP